MPSSYAPASMSEKLADRRVTVSFISGDGCKRAPEVMRTCIFQASGIKQKCNLLLEVGAAGIGGVRKYPPFGCLGRLRKTVRLVLLIGRTERPVLLPSRRNTARFRQPLSIEDHKLPRALIPSTRSTKRETAAVGYLASLSTNTFPSAASSEPFKTLSHGWPRAVSTPRVGFIPSTTPRFSAHE